MEPAVANPSRSMSRRRAADVRGGRRGRARTGFALIADAALPRPGPVNDSTTRRRAVTTAVEVLAAMLNRHRRSRAASYRDRYGERF